MNLQLILEVSLGRRQEVKGGESAGQSGVVLEASVRWTEKMMWNFALLQH